MTGANPSTYRLLFFFARNANLSLPEFKQFYEATHAPRVSALTDDPSTRPLLYKRRYLDRGEASQKSAFGEGALVVPEEFDVVTELVFENKEQAERFKERLYGVEENREKMLEDEEYMLSSRKRGGAVVEECGK
jgi:hypothetical protein